MIVAVNEDEITADVAARLVAAQFPQWAGLPVTPVALNGQDNTTLRLGGGVGPARAPPGAGLPVTPVALNGQDNTTFRLGDELSLRLPSASCVPQVAKEHRWLPVLARQLALPVPEPVARGRPGEGCPRPWSVYRWIAGEPASTGQIADLTGFACGLAGFLVA